ncbi:hypothetical protein [Ramlibacter alkalitolerans]|jgi:hypothetical protein|uniref:Flagellar protein FliT n=1 Tax=Ramlibacter alkalitolerans TaxID=2039631 RepID=A0ABS1JQX4_9BURK|nr:hypothetical protein [Ramlibacter alkalitolerans]MBL0426655.1 hypothetical protein [Ramlibacter alkalitolerans]
MNIKEFSPRVVTFKLAAALEQYELDLRALTEGWLDADAFRRLQQEFGAMRVLGAALPRLSVSWVAVMVSRNRLLRSLCGRSGSVLAALQEHLAAVEGLRARCLRMMGAQTPALA